MLFYEHFAVGKTYLASDALSVHFFFLLAGEFACFSIPITYWRQTYVLVSRAHKRERESTQLFLTGSHSIKMLFGKQPPGQFWSNKLCHSPVRTVYEKIQIHGNVS